VKERSFAIERNVALGEEIRKFSLIVGWICFKKFKLGYK